MTTPIQLGRNRETTLKHAYASYADEVSRDCATLIARKVVDLGFYDVHGMDRAVAICFWGRSGSFLLASYLDWHEDVIMLPLALSRWIYPFYEEYSFLPLREKLIAYPDFFEMSLPTKSFFAGAFAIAEADYYAAINAILEVYGSQPPDFLNSRRAFFVFLHVAYSLALGRRPASPQPLMVYAQHQTSPKLAQRFIEDLPAGRFIHMVHDPISTTDSWFAYGLKHPFMLGRREPHYSPGYNYPPQWVLADLASSDSPLAGAEARSRAVRFEDLHLKTGETMNRVASWLGLTPSPSLVRSTFNGIEYLVGEDHTAWSGARPEQAQRHARNLFPFDRALLFALFYNNFVRWGYPCPAIFARPSVRRTIAALVWFLPMKSELLVAKTLGKWQFLPALRGGHLRFIARISYRLLRDGIRVRRLLTAQIFRRVADRVEIHVLLDTRNGLSDQGLGPAQLEVRRKARLRT